MVNSLLQDIKEKIEKNFEKGELQEWKNKDYEELSFQILQKTNILISSSTLKRIFGKRKTNERYTPQEATLNALKEYANSLSASANEVQDNGSLKKRWVASAILIAVSVLITFYITKRDSLDSVTATVHLERIEGKNTASAFFKLSLPHTGNDNLQIYFGDFSDTVSVSSGTKSIAHYYKLPGIFYPRVIYDGKTINVPEPVIVRTEGWIALGTYPRMKLNNTVFPIPSELLQKPQGYLYASTSDISKCGVDTTELVQTRYYNYQDFGIDGDNFSLKLKVKNTQFWPKVQCNNVIIIVKGRNGVIQQFFPKPGCSFWIESIFSEVRKNGRQHDLTALCYDLSDWTEIKIESRDKQIAFYFNDKPAYTDSYKENLGEIIGIEVHFYGTGYLDNFHLSSADGVKEYKNNFELK